MKLSEQTRNRADAEYLILCNKLTEMSDLIDAHESYAKEFGFQAYCNFSGTDVWPMVYVRDASSYDFTGRMYADKPLYMVKYKGFVLNVREW